MCPHTGFASRVQAQHQQAHLFRSEDLVHQLGNLLTHGGGSVGGLFVVCLLVGGGLELMAERCRS